MSTDMDIVNDPTDNFDSACKHIESPTDKGTIHVGYRLTDAQVVTRGKRQRPVSRDGTLTIDGVPVFPLFGSTAPELDFPALLGVLGYIDGERISIAHRNGHKNAPMITAVMPVADAVAYVAGLPANHDIYFGINPLADHVRSYGAKGKADDVIRLGVLPADLDVKEGGCTDLAHAHRIIDELSNIIGNGPVAIIHSGKGLQPLWLIVGGERNDTINIAVILKRWGRLVTAVAKAHAAGIDSIQSRPDSACSEHVQQQVRNADSGCVSDRFGQSADVARD